MQLNRDLPISNDRVVEALRGNHPAKRCGCWMTSRFRSLTQSLVHSTSKFQLSTLARASQASTEDRLIVEFDKAKALAQALTLST